MKKRKIENTNGEKKKKKKETQRRVKKFICPTLESLGCVTRQRVEKKKALTYGRWERGGLRQNI